MMFAEVFIGFFYKYSHMFIEYSFEKIFYLMFYFFIIDHEIDRDR